MAEAVVSLVVQKLGDFLIQEAEFLYGVRGQVKWIQDELRGIQCFLKDADNKRKGNDERAKNWVRDVRDVACDAEDVVETFVLKIERRRRRRGFGGLVIRYALIFGELIACYKIGLDISEIKSRILDISDRRARYGIANIGESGGAGGSHADESVQARRRILPHVDDSDTVGFEDDRKAIVEQLLDPRNTRLCVISIVGMGGQGKTTLAKKVYNTGEIKRSFEKYAWISVSQDYSGTKIFKNIMRKIMGISEEELDRMEEDDLKEKLHEFLKDKRYLIVMDDIWSTEVWKKIVPAFPDAKIGSRIIFTSRLIDVAKSADPDSPPYELRFLDGQESWELFLRKVFPNQDVKTSCPENLEMLGRELVKRCGGLPLALVVLGGMLSKKDKNPVVWSKVKKSLKWEADKDGKQCLDVLALSYEDLPYDLKSCFLYLGCFPEDSEIRASKLIRLWTAEGFIPARERETLEETAADYLEELVQRCVVQVVERRSDGGVKTFRVHDLLRELCISEAKEARFADVYSTEDQTTSSASRRVALFHCSADHVLESLNSSSQFLRTLVGFNWHASTGPVDLRLHSLKLLRVIDLEGASLQELPEEIKSIIHLRYLGLRRTRVSDIPPSIGDLCYLQTLDVRRTPVRSLPDAFWKIRSLRHVFFSRACAIPIPRKICAAKNLQTLKEVRGGSWIEKQLPQLTNLQNLTILDVSDLDEMMLFNSLKNLSSLVSLALRGTLIPTDIIPALSGHEHLHALRLSGPMSKRPQLPNSNEFPQNLTKLTLQGSNLEVDPMATLEKLQNLRVLRLRFGAYAGKEMICSAGGFLQLQWLHLQGLRALENWRVEEGAMPGLIHLSIVDCNALKMLPQGLRYVTTLKELELVFMPATFRDRVRENGGEDWVAINHVSSIIIK
ncbi:putative disease resistance protein At1g50180 [Phoenix dactylifera]|uniref:Disease resistance protein At1g50180 n=1 Tax=Phoenix dactylifera TaxID=42345 RepID=A0A8B8ZHK5_PHODC|nr:putative disease resistance protein At1g50180 [Phoenix dactylifera]